jgi:hypothetical protein
MAQNKHDTSFLNLFDGKSLDGWKIAGKGKTEGGMGLFWYYRRNSKTLLWNLNGRHPV